MNWIKTIIHALAASMTTKVFAMGLRFVTICLLPLWLTPAEIGWNAVILAIINFVIAIIDFGFGTALIKEKTCTVRMYQSVLTFILMISVVGSGAMISFADEIARVFSFPPIILVISAFAIPFSVFAIVPNALLQRELRFTASLFAISSAKSHLVRLLFSWPYSAIHGFACQSLSSFNASFVGLFQR